MGYRWSVNDLALIEKLLGGHAVEPSDAERASRLSMEIQSLRLAMDGSKQMYCYTYGRDAS